MFCFSLPRGSEIRTGERMTRNERAPASHMTASLGPLIRKTRLGVGSDASFYVFFVFSVAVLCGVGRPVEDRGRGTVHSCKKQIRALWLFCVRIACRGHGFVCVGG
ncbi:unnamed protein product [Hapterophycus canaliculatus]